MADDVQLTDLEVIQQFSLAVRGATAPRAQVIEALEADLAYLRAAPKATAPAKQATSPAPKKATPPAPANKATAPAKAARARKA